MDHALLDTDTFSELLRGKNAVVTQRGDAYRQQFDCFTISAVTVVEVVKGFQQAGREDQIPSLIDHFAGLEVLPVDVDVALIAGRIYGELLRIGPTIGRADPMIAAVALQHDLTLVTANIEHFERIARLGYPLLLDNWRP